MRILITVKPQMYREAIAISIYRDHPTAEILLAPPESLDGEMRRFRPQLIVCNDTDWVSPDTLAGAPHWVKVLYSDSMDVEVILDGRARTVRDMGMDGLLRVIDEVEGIISGGTTE